MATIYAVYDSSGCVGRCDAKCHDAKGEDCRCICGGAMHGVGGRIAWEDRRELTDDEILDNARKLLGKGTVRLARAVEQLGLFGPIK